MMAVILAAGVSSRLLPLTETIPKSLLSLDGIPLLRRTLNALQRNRIEDVLIVTGYLRETIERSVGEWNIGIRIQYIFNPLFASTNNNYSLWIARGAAAGQDLLLLDADILCDWRIIAALLRSNYQNALLVRRSTHLSEEEIKVELDAAGRITTISKELDPHKAVGESVGIEKFSQATAARLFATLDRRKHRDEFYEASFQDMIQQGTEIYAVESGPYTCMEIDTPDDLRRAMELARTLET
jgi:choline kinase